ncbi:MAG: sugar nucleotide-binding protein [Pirellulales bacterium]
MDKLLLVGADSMLGANLALAFEERFDTVGVACHLPSVSGCRQTIVADPLDPGVVARVFADQRPNWVILCGPTSRSSWEAGADEQPANAIPVAKQLVAATAEQGAALAIISSDAVFAGPRLFHEEMSRSTADTPYARSGRALEDALAGTPALVVRTHAYGWAPCDHTPSYIESLVDRLTATPATAGDGVRYATPILATDLADLLATARAKQLRGLYHITGAERTNQNRFASELAGVLDLIHRPTADPGTDATTSVASRPLAETSLNTRRARRALGLPMPLLREGLERLAAQRDNGYRARMRGEPAPHSQRVRAA